MSENTRRLLDDLWEYLGFVANAFLFLLVGFSANLGSMLADAWPVAIAVLACSCQERSCSLPRG